MYIVLAKPPLKPTLKWSFDKNYFPHKCHYKTDANRIYERALRQGGRGVYLKPFVQSQYDADFRSCREDIVRPVMAK